MMKGYLNDELIENTYLFCLKRVSDSEEAKDLSQDILYEALRQIARDKEFVSFHSWYWQMARNKYADFIAHKQNPSLSIETAGGVAADIAEPIESLINSEDISELNFSISRLASIHREIVIRFYLKEQPIATIAKELNIPEGTVKRRLFDAKKDLKERLDNMKNAGKSSYAPAKVNWFGGFACMQADSLLRNNIAKQVCVVCRSKAKAINEIADEMGVAPIYLEPILEEMTDGKLLKSPVKNKYISNFCIFPKTAYLDAEMVACEEFRSMGYAEKISNILLGLKDKIASLDFYSNDFDYKYLMWLLYVLAGDVFGVIGGERYIQKYEGKYEDEIDRKYRITMNYILPDEDENIVNSKYQFIKSEGWSNLHQHFLTSDYGRLEFVNDFDTQPFPTKGCDGVDYGRDEWLNGNNISLLLSLAEDPNKTLNTVEEEMAAEFIKNGLLEKTEVGLRVMLPIFEKKVYQKIYDIVREALRELVCEYADAVGKKIENILLKYVRKELMSNFIHWDMRVLLQAIEYLFYYGMHESDHLAIPEDYNHSAAGLYIIKR